MEEVNPTDRRDMVRSLQSSAGTAVRDFVPFLVIMTLWIVTMSVLYTLFLLLRPAGASYGTVIHASVFVPPLVGFVGHVVRETIRTE